MSAQLYPWFGVVADTSIEQGDIFENCPVVVASSLEIDTTDADRIEWELRDVIVMSQSCDLVEGREKLSEVVLAAVWVRSELSEFKGDKDMEDARRGNRPAFHVLNKSILTGMDREIRLVDFSRIHTLPIMFLRRRTTEPRLRLLPPYREHLSQAFARFFMRVGLPADIPSFLKR